jgi:hypothetical protein
MRMMVVFPLPLGPINPIRSRALTLNETFCKTVWIP